MEEQIPEVLRWIPIHQTFYARKSLQYFRVFLPKRLLEKTLNEDVFKAFTVSVSYGRRILCSLRSHSQFWQVCWGMQTPMESWWFPPDPEVLHCNATVTPEGGSSGQNAPKNHTLVHHWWKADQLLWIHHWYVKPWILILIQGAVRRNPTGIHLKAVNTRRIRLISCRYFLNVDKRISLHTLYKLHYSADVWLPCGKLQPAEEHLDTILAVLICLASVYSQRYQRKKLDKPKPVLDGLGKKTVPGSICLTKVATSSVCTPSELCIRKITIYTQNETLFWLGATRLTNGYISSLYLLILCPLHRSLSNQWPTETAFVHKMKLNWFCPSVVEIQTFAFSCKRNFVPRVTKQYWVGVARFW